MRLGEEQEPHAACDLLEHLAKGLLIGRGEQRHRLDYVAVGRVSDYLNRSSKALRALFEASLLGPPLAGAAGEGAVLV